MLETLKETALEDRIMRPGDSLSDFEEEIDWSGADAWRDLMRERADHFLNSVGL